MSDPNHVITWAAQALVLLVLKDIRERIVRLENIFIRGEVKTHAK